MIKKASQLITKNPTILFSIEIEKLKEENL